MNNLKIDIKIDTCLVIFIALVALKICAVINIPSWLIVLIALCTQSHFVVKYNNKEKELQDEDDEEKIL